MIYGMWNAGRRDPFGSSAELEPQAAEMKRFLLGETLLGSYVFCRFVVAGSLRGASAGSGGALRPICSAGF